MANMSLTKTPIAEQEPKVRDVLTVSTSLV